MLNPPPLQTSVDEVKTDQGKISSKLSSIWQTWISAAYKLIRTVTDYSSASRQVPITGFSITLGVGVQVLTLDPAGVLATGTITMPTQPYDGQKVEVSTTQTITALTVSPNTGQTIKNAPTTLAAGSGFAYYYNLPLTTWFRIY